MRLIAFFSSGPATFVVLLIVGVLLVLGALLMGGAKRARQSRPREQFTCDNCDHHNPRNARYCARCGQKLNAAE